MQPKPTSPVPAVLFTTATCPHCRSVKAALQTLLDEQRLASLEVIDVASVPARAAALGVKTVPWFMLGPLAFEGALSLGELRHWADLAGHDAGLQAYFLEMLKSGQRGKVEQVLRRSPAHAAVLGDLLLDPAASMAVRIGIGAVLEELQGSGLTQALVPKLAQLLNRDAAAQDRADAAHYLSLIATPEALDALRAHRDDADPTVREIAQEAVT